MVKIAVERKEDVKVYLNPMTVLALKRKSTVKFKSEFNEIKTTSHSFAKLE